jgi:hypothetical protein
MPENTGNKAYRTGVLANKCTPGLKGGLNYLDLEETLKSCKVDHYVCLKCRTGKPSVSKMMLTMALCSSLVHMVCQLFRDEP